MRYIRRGWRSAAAAALVAMLASTAQAAAPAKLTDQQLEILRFATAGDHHLSKAIAGDGYLTEAMHRAFWADVPPTIAGDPARRTAFAASAGRAIKARLRLEEEAWISAGRSLAAAQVVKSAGFDDALASARATAQALPAGPEREQLETLASQVEPMLAAASAGVTASGTAAERLTPERVLSERSHVRAASFRLARLLEPEWSDAPRVYDYPEAHFRMSWDAPFEMKIHAPGIVILSYWQSGLELALVKFMPMPGHIPESPTVAARLTELSIQEAGLQGAEPATSPFQGHASAETTGRAINGAHASLRTVMSADHGGMWMIEAYAAGPGADASKLREAIEAAVTLE